MRLNENTNDQSMQTIKLFTEQIKHMNALESSRERS